MASSGKKLDKTIDYEAIQAESRSIGQVYESLLPDTTSQQYTRDDMCLAIATFLVVSNVARTARITGFPDSTIRQWFKADWCVALLALLREEKSAEIDAKFSEIIHLATEELKDRVINGDHVLIAKTGELQRVPLTGLNLSKVVGITWDKRALLRAHGKLAKGRAASEQGAMADVLADLAAAGRYIRERDITPTGDDAAQSGHKSTGGEIVTAQNAT